MRKPVTKAKTDSLEFVQLPPIAMPDERLAAVTPGPDVMLTMRAAADIAEWASGWGSAKRLQNAGVPLPGPLLLHGPTGTGKTSVTRMLARQFQGVRQVLVIDSMRVTEQFLGATSANISKAATAAVRAGAVLVLEEVDTLASNRMYGTSANVENTRSTTAIMRVLELGGPIVLTSNRLDVIDQAVIRRCEYVVEMPEPSPAQRVAIIARELGADPGSHALSLPLSVTIPMARRARRISVLAGDSAADAFFELCSAVIMSEEFAKDEAE